MTTQQEKEDEHFKGKTTECFICQESFGFDVADPEAEINYDLELAEFWDPKDEKSFIAHGECGIGQGYGLA